MRAWLGGREAAFAELVARHGLAVKCFALRMLRDEAQAEEVYAETFLRVAAGRWQPTGSARGWIFTVARRLCLDLLRQRRTARENVPHLVELNWGAPPSNPESQTLAAEQASWLEAGLARLPEEHREVLLLRVVHGMSAAEVGEVLGLAEHQVHSQVSYARKCPRALLEESSEQGVEREGRR